MMKKTLTKSEVAQTLEVSGARKTGRKVKLYLLLALAVIIVAAIVLALAKTNGTSNAAQYKTEEISRGDLTVTVTATGTLEPTNTVKVGSELSGTIKTVNVDYNSKVIVGQVLCTLDTAKLETSIVEYKAALESARAKASLSQATLKETKAKLEQLKKVHELSSGKVPSQLEMDAAEAAHERAKADAVSAAATVSQAQATLGGYQADLSKSVIKSPINGIVLTRSVDPGQTIAASMTAPELFTLAEDLTKIDLRVNVDEADIGKIQEGQKTTFTVAAHPNRTFNARIAQARFGSTTNSGVVTYVTVLKVDNKDMSLRPGMTATADIIVEKIEKATLVPSAALRFTPPVQEKKGSSSGSLVGSLFPRPPKSETRQTDNSNKKEQQVWVLNNKQLAPVSVTTGLSNGILTEITDGNIQPGTAVVVDMMAGE
jgi:HlyD family secretion protein